MVHPRAMIYRSSYIKCIYIWFRIREVSPKHIGFLYRESLLYLCFMCFGDFNANGYVVSNIHIFTYIMSHVTILFLKQLISNCIFYVFVAGNIYYVHHSLPIYTWHGYLSRYICVKNNRSFDDLCKERSTLTAEKSPVTSRFPVQGTLQCSNCVHVIMS